MMRFCANLTMMFQEVPFLERFAAAAHAGFAGVEYVGAYDYPLSEVASRLRDAGVQQVLMNMPAGDWQAGDRGIAALAHRRDEFQRSIDVALEWAKELGCTRLHCMSGIVPLGSARQDCLTIYCENLALAAERLGPEGITLLVEPINPFDIPGYLINTTGEAMAVIAATGADNVKLQFDVYHAQRMEGDLARLFTRLLPHIAHVQIADNPGRHEPGSGEIAYAFLLRHMAQSGYQGWTGCEYIPLRSTLEGLHWMKMWNQP